MGLLSMLKGSGSKAPEEELDRNVEEEIARHLWVSPCRTRLHEQEKKMRKQQTAALPATFLAWSPPGLGVVVSSSLGIGSSLTPAPHCT